MSIFKGKLPIIFFMLLAFAASLASCMPGFSTPSREDVAEAYGFPQPYLTKTASYIITDSGGTRTTIPSETYFSATGLFVDFIFMLIAIFLYKKFQKSKVYAKNRDAIKYGEIACFVFLAIAIWVTIIRILGTIWPSTEFLGIPPYYVLMLLYDLYMRVIWALPLPYYDWLLDHQFITSVIFGAYTFLVLLVIFLTGTSFGRWHVKNHR